MQTNIQAGIQTYIEADKQWQGINDTQAYIQTGIYATLKHTVIQTIIHTYIHTSIHTYIYIRPAG